MSPPRGQRTALTYAVVLASFAGLVLAQLLDSWLRQAPPTIWALRVVPLLLFLPGVLRDFVRTHIWLGFVILMYFITLVLRLFKEPDDLVSWTGMICTLILFNAGMLYVRWRSRELNVAREAHGGNP